MSPQLEIQLIAIVVAVACSLPGVFLVLRKMAMITDAITHTILLGIVIAFFAVHDLNSPILLIGATIVGLATVYLVELLNKTRLMSEDSAIGVIFPLLFSIAIILVSRYSGKVHLDTDSVLLGELAFAPFNRFYIGSVNMGPKALYMMGFILIINLLAILLFFKELKISVFDQALASVLGFSPVLIQYGLMTSVSLTTVGAFEAVGSILVIGFMIGPPITAYLLTDNLKGMLWLSGLIGAFNAVVGYQIASYFDVSIAGTIATVIGFTFLIVFIASPKRGLLSYFIRRKRQKERFAQQSFIYHLYHHELKKDANIENRIDSIDQHLNWSKQYLLKQADVLKKKGYIIESNHLYELTTLGRDYAEQSYQEMFDQIN